jgi:CRP-like cAMP-binding protein
MPRSKNLFLSSLSPASRQFLTSRSTPVALGLRAKLYKPEQRPPYAYFMTSGIASVVTEMIDGGSAEVGMMGREGVVGALHVLGPALSPAQCFIQMEGAALRINMQDLRDAFEDSTEIRTRLLELVQKETMVLSQIAGCHRLHSAEERLARWLLMAQDQTQTDVLAFTQEFLANMLGARRATVTVVAGTLQQAGLIQYNRGHVKVLDREKLEAAACDCYRVIKEVRGDLYNES